MDKTEDKLTREHFRAL